MKLSTKIFIGYGVLIVIALAILLIAFTGCSTSNKTKSTYKEKTTVTTEQKKGIDTTASKKTDVQQQIKTETAAGSVEETETKKEFNIEFNLGGNGTAEEYTGKPLDTTVNGTKVKTNDAASLKFNPDGSIEAKGNIKNINYKETGSKKKQDSTRTTQATDTRLAITDTKKGIDTSAGKTIITTEITATNKHKQTTSYWGWLWIGIVCAGVYGIGWYFGWWRWLFAFIKRRNRDEYPIIYKKPKP